MEIGADIQGEEGFLLREVPNGVFVTKATSGQRLFFVSLYFGEPREAFPVLQDGTVCQTRERCDSSEPVKVFLAKDIPGLQIDDGKIVWAGKSVTVE